MISKMLKFGCEIEGEFSNELIADLEARDGVGIGTDGSVNLCDNRQNQGFDHSSFRTREVRLEPLTVKNFEVTAPKFFNELKWGKNFHSNSSSGFHVHISFDPKEPPELMSGDFFKAFLESVKKKFPDEYALRRRSTYCKFEGLNKSDMIDEKIRDGSAKTGDRYVAINLTALEKHGTIEFRLWPSNEPQKMIEYLRHTITFVRDWLETDHKYMASLTKRSAMPPRRTIRLDR